MCLCTHTHTHQLSQRYGTKIGTITHHNKQEKFVSGPIAPKAMGEGPSTDPQAFRIQSNRNNTELILQWQWFVLITDNNLIAYVQYQYNTVQYRQHRWRLDCSN